MIGNRQSCMCAERRETEEKEREGEKGNNSNDACL